MFSDVESCNEKLKNNFYYLDVANSSRCNLAHLEGTVLGKVTNLFSSCADGILDIEIKTNSRINDTCTAKFKKQFITVRNKRSYLTQICVYPRFVYYKLCKIRKEVPTDEPANTVTKSFNPLWILLIFCIICVICCVYCVCQKKGNVSLLKLMYWWLYLYLKAFLKIV